MEKESMSHHLSDMVEAVLLGMAWMCMAASRTGSLVCIDEVNYKIMGEVCRDILSA